MTHDGENGRCQRKLLQLLSKLETLQIRSVATKRLDLIGKKKL